MATTTTTTKSGNSTGFLENSLSQPQNLVINDLLELNLYNTQGRLNLLRPSKPLKVREPVLPPHPTDPPCLIICGARR